MDRTSVNIGQFLNQTGYMAQGIIDERIHPAIYAVTGIDMDDVQKRVFDSIEPFNAESGMRFLCRWTVIWFIIIAVSAWAIPYVISCISNEIRGIYDKASPFKRLMLACRILYSPLHLSICIPAVFYGLIYADGKPGTSWFADEHYWITAYDYQKFFMVWMFAYFLAETVYMTFFLSYEPKMMQVYMHHLISSIAILPGLYFGGWAFSQNYMVTLCEITNPCNNLRGLLLDIERPGGFLWTFNGLVWLFFFFWFRTVLFTYLVFTKTMVCIDGFTCPDYQSSLEGYDVLVMRFY